MVSRQAKSRKQRYAEDPEYRKKQCEIFRSYWAANKDEINARRRARLRTDPEYRKKANSAIARAATDSPGMITTHSWRCKVASVRSAARIAPSASTIVICSTRFAVCFATNAISALGCSMTIRTGSGRRLIIWSVHVARRSRCDVNRPARRERAQPGRRNVDP